jgi:hypothetical protein
MSRRPEKLAIDREKLVHDLSAALMGLLACSELNSDDLEDGTLEAIKNASYALHLLGPGNLPK